MKLRTLARDALRSEHAQKRGGGATKISLDVEGAENEVQPLLEASIGMSVEERDELIWAASILHRAERAFIQEKKVEGRDLACELMLPLVKENRNSRQTQEVVALALSCLEGGQISVEELRVRVSRLRKAWQAKIKDFIFHEVAHDLQHEWPYTEPQIQQIQQEIGILFRNASLLL